MGRIIYSDGRTALTTTAFRYKLTDATGTLVKDWTTGATWTEEPAGTYYLDDEDAVPGTYYAVEPATGQVGGTGQVPLDTVTLAADQPLYAPTTWRDLAQLAKKEDVQITVNPTLTPEESAKLLGAAQEATLEAVKLRTDTLDAATGTLTLPFRLLLDSDGDGIPDDPLVGVGGITCHLLAHGTHTRIRESATTDSQGYVYWHGLAAGTYDVDPDAAGYEGVTVAVTIPE